MNHTSIKVIRTALLLMAALLGHAQPTSARAATDHVLFEGGVTPYRIVVAPDASESEKWAARELARVLGEISGAHFPIVDDDFFPAHTEIVVGHNELLEHVFGHGVVPRPEPGDESFHIYSKGPTIFIMGGSQRGTMYGVFTFLEDYLGCRWWTPRVEDLPRRDRWSFTQIEHHEEPGLRFRDVDYFGAYDGKRGVLGKMNSQRFMRSRKPGGVERFWFEHSFEWLIPAAQYFDAHPEYFSLVDGERLRERTQLCLTNPEVFELAMERFRTLIDQLPEYRVYHVAQNDNQNYCECEGCTALAEAEGSQSGPVLHFVNRIAEEIEKTHPDLIVGTFAYQYTRKPPRHARPRDNVMVVLCNIECDFSHPLTHPNNAGFVEDVEGWTAITDRIYIWDYVVNYRGYFLPHPNFSVLQPNIQFFLDHGVLGILEQAQHQSHGGEFAELRAYLLAELLWNPGADTRVVIEDFINGYYGRSAPWMLRYFDLVQSLVTDETYLTFATRPTNPVFTQEFIEAAGAIFDEAERVAESTEVWRRVRKERLGIIYLQLVLDPAGAVARGLDDALERITEREGIVFSSEGTRAVEFLEWVREQADPPAEAEQQAESREREQ